MAKLGQVDGIAAFSLGQSDSLAGNQLLPLLA